MDSQQIINVTKIQDEINSSHTTHKILNTKILIKTGENSDKSK